MLPMYLIWCVDFLTLCRPSFSAITYTFIDVPSLKKIETLTKAGGGSVAEWLERRI